MHLPLRSRRDAGAVPVHRLTPETLPGFLSGLSERARRWVAATGFAAEPGSRTLVPGEDGGLELVLAGATGEDELSDGAALGAGLPAGSYALGSGFEHGDLASLGWALSAYGYQRYKSEKKPAPGAELSPPESVDVEALERVAASVFLTRDLINTPASDMGPEELAAAAGELASEFGGDLRVIVGEDLLEQDFPMVHAVGRASDRAPRLVDWTWGDPSHPRIAIVGKGVCFDSGGLDLKPAQGMLLMKKDMGGAAHALGLARLVAASGLPVRMRLVVPAVENSVSGNAMRPLDVIPTRAGKTVEIGNTDAEGRLVLADALALAAADQPEVMIDFATLTGAARVALGLHLPALFCNDDDLAQGILEQGEALRDPVWRMPLHAPYRPLLDSPVADLVNVSEGPWGGAITAALFLQEFVEPRVPWAHVDVMAWNTTTKPGAPKGGEAMSLRAMFGYLDARYGSA